MNKKVLLIHPSALFASDWNFLREFRLQLLTLFSFLKENGIPVDVLDLEREIGLPGNFQEASQFKRKAKHLLSQYSFDIVAISCYGSTEFLSSLQVAQACKEINKNCKIILLPL